MSADDFASQRYSTELAKLARSLEAMRQRYEVAADRMRETHQALQTLSGFIAATNAGTETLIRQWQEKEPALRAALLLVAADPHFEAVPARAMIRLVEQIISEHAAGYGSKGGTKTGAKRRNAFDEAGGVAARRAKWEALRAVGKRKGVCDELTARAFKVRPATIANMRSASGSNGDRWQGDD
ncbi:hypothetical protein QF000_005393 [Paraburkholderia atlantica]|uniref:hypothetical protein n=1 Tax=Paraburkholderia atlantica TaxID=2654982 RepID=UPI003D1D27C8